MTVSWLNLEQRRALDRAKERLVPAAEELLKIGQVVDIKLRHFGQSQMRNLIAVALATESPAVVANFIRYQVGRDAKGKTRKGNSWASYPKDLKPPRRLGQLFIEQMEEGGGVIETEMATLSGQGDLFADPVSRQLARMELIRQFLGFVDRHLKFLSLQRSDDRRDGENGADEEDEA
jgi:hypothetical protein